MASPFQQQAQRRKLLYIGLILVLFIASFAWRQLVVNAEAAQLAIREEQRGEVELVGSVVRTGLTGSRGLVICLLWNTAIEKQKRNEWNEMEVYVRALTKLQPHFITPWLFQSWNLAYNVSVESDRVRDKYFYITRGIELLAEGERQNQNHPDLRWSIGFYLQHKICLSDETNYKRSLFQLSLIPPNERDPARFYKQQGDRRVFDWAEFRDFVEKHPQLVRRLKQGMYRETRQAKEEQFTCDNPAAVVQFLEDNFQVPSLYRQPPRAGRTPGGEAAAAYDRTRRDLLLAVEERFPVLPPPHDRPFDPDALTSDFTPRDDTDAYAAAQAWYAYAQEPLPEPGALPGNSKTVTDRTRQRLPKHMTTLIFRNYPAQGRRYQAERLQQEGWYDDEPWDVSDWFADARELAGVKVRVGGGREWSLDAWRRAAAAWDRHGRENHLLFPTAAAEQRERDLAERFASRYGQKVGFQPPRLREEDMSKAEKEEYQAARYMAEYQFYRQVSNFAHHHLRTQVEARPETVEARKLLWKAEEAYNAGNGAAAIKAYTTPVASKAWPGRTLSPLQAWRDLVLAPNKAFRRDSNTQETSAEYQLRYQMLWNRQDGKKLKEDLGRMAPALPLMPKFTDATFRPLVFQGPFDRTDDEGVPLIEKAQKDRVLDRMHLPRPKDPLAPPPNAKPAPPKARRN
jgi:hypothetical protein